MDTRSEGGLGGAVGLLPSPVAVRDPGDPAAVATPTKTLRIVIDGSRAAGGPGPLPGQRGTMDDVTTRLPAIRDDGPGRAPGARRPGGTGARERDGTASGAAPARPGVLQGGTVLLPLRLFLGGAFLVEGLRKLYAPGFLDPGSADSFGHRIGVLRDGSLSPSVMDLAANHAIGTGLLFAFGQVVVGFAAVFGLWTRLAGLMGMLLSLGVLIAVGTSGSPYHAPYVVFLAAWSPLALAGAPMYSADAWLSLRTWRGPIVTPVRARRRKLGYGSMLACAGVGATLLAGSLLGGGHRAVDESDTGRVEGPTGPVSSPAAPGGSVAPGVASRSTPVGTQPRPPVKDASAPVTPRKGGEDRSSPATPRASTASMPAATAPRPAKPEPARTPARASNRPAAPATGGGETPGSPRSEAASGTDVGPAPTAAPTKPRTGTRPLDSLLG